MTEAATLPRPARLLVAAVAAAALVALAAQAPDLADWSGADLLACVALAAAAATTEAFQIELSYRNEKVTYSISDEVWTAALLLARPGVLVYSVAVGVLAGQAVQSWAPVKVAFNVAQFVLGTTAAVVVFGVFEPSGITEPGGWLAAAVAMAAFHVVNTVVMGAIIAITERQPFWQVALVPTGVLHWVGNISIGTLAALVWDTEPSPCRCCSCPSR